MNLAAAEGGHGGSRGSDSHGDSARRHLGIVGSSRALTEVLTLVRTVAPTDATVLIEGETGTGKELVARAIHELSARGAHAFVKMNCAAIPSGLLESELFGHERGAFTGAVNARAGRFEIATRGSVFLDEIGEMPMELQPKLLRVLQEHEFERLGSTRTVRSDARIVAATNRDLASLVAAGQFRADLFYRFNVFPIRVPALRERRADIPLLVRHFVERFAGRLGRSISVIPDGTMDALVGHEWPGNIRELQNVIERAVILTTGAVLQLPPQTFRPVGHGAHAPQPRTMEDMERAHILTTLAATNGVVAGPRGAASVLGMNRSTLLFRMRRLGITRPPSSWQLGQ